MTITIGAVNDAPVAAGDSYATAEDTPLTVAAPGVLGNDNDVETPVLTADARRERLERDRDARRERRLHLHAQRELQRDRHVHLHGE